MSKVNISYDSVGDIERAIIAAKKAVDRDPSKANKHYLRLLFQAWQRKDWAIERALNYMEELVYPKETITLVGTTKTIGQGSSDSPIDQVLHTQKECFITKVYWAFGDGDQFNLTSDQGLQMALYVDGDLKDFDSTKESPYYIGVYWRVYRMYQLKRPEKVPAGKKATVTLINYGGVSIAGCDARLIYYERDIS